MTPEEIFEAFNNAWRALCVVYSKSPDASTQNALNMLAKIIGQVKHQHNEVLKEKDKAGQMSIEEWLEWLNEE